MANDYYHQIGVAPDATEQEIKHAIAQKKKELMLARDDEKLNNLNQISKTLRDPESRKEYDTLQKHGETIARYLMDADDAQEKGDIELLLLNLRKANALLPSDSLDNRIALALGNLHRHIQAIALYDRLISKNPDKALYLSNGSWAYQYLGFTATDLHGDAICPHCRKPNKAVGTEGPTTITCRHCSKPYDIYIGDSGKCFHIARNYLTKAVEIDQYSEEPIIELAELEGYLGNTDRAAELIAKAVRLDGKIGPDDLSSYIALMNIYAEADEYTKIEELGRIIKSEIVCDDKEFWHYAQVVILKEFDDEFDEKDFYAKDYKLMSSVASAIEVLGPLDDKYGEYFAFVHQRAKVNEQVLKVIHDDKCDAGLLELVRLIFCIDEEIKVENMSERKLNIFEYFTSLSATQRNTVLGYLRITYPVVWANMQERITKFLAEIPTPESSSYQSNAKNISNSSSTPSSGSGSYQSGSSSSTAASSGSGCVVSLLVGISVLCSSIYFIWMILCI